MDLSRHQQPNAATRTYVDFVHSIVRDPKQVGAGWGGWVECRQLAVAKDARAGMLSPIPSPPAAAA